jgi:hypothetical protein
MGHPIHRQIKDALHSLVLFLTWEEALVNDLEQNEQEGVQDTAEHGSFRSAFFYDAVGEKSQHSERDKSCHYEGYPSHHYLPNRPDKSKLFVV